MFYDLPSALRCARTDSRVRFNLFRDVFFFRQLLQEIRGLREERDATTDQPNDTTADPALVEELKGLRQKKDELELRMSGLQETRKELMSQLEGLMSILKVRYIYKLTLL